MEATGTQNTAAPHARRKPWREWLSGWAARYALDGMEGLWGPPRTRPFIEQLGVSSHRRPDLAWCWDLSTRGAAGLSAKWKVAQQGGGLDYRAQLRELTEQRVNQWSLPTRQKALLMAALYEVARRLPGR